MIHYLSILITTAMAVTFKNVQCHLIILQRLTPQNILENSPPLISFQQKYIAKPLHYSISPKCKMIHLQMLSVPKRIEWIIQN